MDFLKKIEPHLVSDDLLVQEFVMHALQEFPDVPEEWTTLLLKEAIAKKEKEIIILANIDSFRFNSESLAILLEGALETDYDSQFLYSRLIRNLDPVLKLKHRGELEQFLPQKDFEFYQLLMTADKAAVWNEYDKVLSALSQQLSFDHDAYTRAKEIARILVERGLVDQDYIKSILEDQKQHEFFQLNGILAVYMAGIMKLNQLIPILAGLLDQEDDLLQEEVADALSAFQSDEAVEQAAPFINDSPMSIYPISILGNTKTDQSIEKLKNLYTLVDDEENKVLIVEALCHQLSEKGLEVVEKAAEEDFYSDIYESERIFYGFYKVMGVQHPKLGEWVRLANQRDEDYVNRKQELETAVPQNQPVINDSKVGRNDPCPCGSGKKYKKCCGQ
jgi:hypothetical protein